MKHKFLKIGAWASSILLASLIFGWIWSLWTDPSDRIPYISLTRYFHVAITPWQGGRIHFFNDADYGPYFGGTMFIKVKGWDEHYGIQYRYFKMYGKIVRTLSICIWYPLIIFSTLPLVFLIQKLKSRTSLKSESSDQVKPDSSSGAAEKK